jgi:hypothetical protein
MSLADELVKASTWGRVEPDGSLADPQWAKAGRVHDWRNYVPQVIRIRWTDLSDDARAVAFVIADEAAAREEWD